MDWVLTALVLTTGPNFAQTHSYSFVNFTSEKLCNEAVETLKKNYVGTASGGLSVEVRAACLQRKDAR